MPIRLNLLAEAQALEELRRKDPVKRAMLVAILIVAGVVSWSLFLWTRIMVANSQLSGLEAKLNANTNRYNEVLTSKRKLTEYTYKLDALNHFATNRYLHAPMLDALQHTTVDGIQLTRLRTEQSFDVIPPVLASKNENGQTIPGKPGHSTERIKILVDLRDNSENPGRELINKFEQALAQGSYFECSRISTNSMVLKSLSAPTVGLDSDKPFVQINLELLYPDRVR